LIKVNIESTSGKYDIDGIKEFENLDKAIQYCWDISDYEEVIVKKPYTIKIKTVRELSTDYDYDLEIYDDNRE
jgi:hypothetical protein